MGIYSNGSIFGIIIYKPNSDDSNHILFEKTYDVIMSDEQKKDAYVFYMDLNDKDNLCFKIYTECSSTYDIHNKETFMMWHSISLKLFVDTFGSSL